MREEYELKELNPRKNPYVNQEKEQITMAFQRLEDLRIDANLTQEQADILGCKREVYCRYEKGIHEIPV